MVIDWSVTEAESNPAKSKPQPEPKQQHKTLAAIVEWIFPLHHRFVDALGCSCRCAAPTLFFCLFLASVHNPAAHNNLADIRGSTSAPPAPGRTHTHTHTPAPERGRAKAPNWSSTASAERHNRRSNGSLWWTLRVPEGTRSGRHIRD